jgi:hypothetical protein
MNGESEEELGRSWHAPVTEEFSEQGDQVGQQRGDLSGGRPPTGDDENNDDEQPQRQHGCQRENDGTHSAKSTIRVSERSRRPSTMTTGGESLSCLCCSRSPGEYARGPAVLL